MMFVEIFFIGFLINIWHCQGTENLLTNNEIRNSHLSPVLENKPTAQEKFSTNDGLIFTDVPTSNQYVNHHPTFEVKSLENSGGSFQLNYFNPNDQLLSRNHVPVSTNTLIENSYQSSQRKPLPNIYSINSIPYLILHPKPNPGIPFFPQSKYSKSHLTLYPKPHLRSSSECIILRMNPRLNLKPPFNNINSQKGGPNQVSRNEYFYRPSIPNNLIYQMQDVTNSERALRNKFIEFNNQASTGRHNSMYSQPINPFLMKIIQSNNRNNRAKKHINVYPHSNLVSNNKSSAENCQGCRGLIFVTSTPTPESAFSPLINSTLNTKNKTSESSEKSMNFYITGRERLLAQDNSTFNEKTNVNSNNMNSTEEILVSPEKVISTDSNLNYGQKIPADDMSKINDKISETKSFTEIIVVFDKKKSTPD